MITEIIITEFLKEFSCISSKFVIINERTGNLLTSDQPFIFNPGVYVITDGTRVIKVGRHLTNSRKRAFEHITDNTKNEKIAMGNLKDCPLSETVLINVKDLADYHWVAAVEIYLEKRMDPEIKSKRC